MSELYADLNFPKIKTLNVSSNGLVICVEDLELELRTKYGHRGISQ